MKAIIFGSHVLATGGGYSLARAHSLMPPRALAIQVTTIALSGLLQAFRYQSQGFLVKKGIRRLDALKILNFVPLVLIGGGGLLARTPWKVNLLAILFFAPFHLALAKISSFVDTNRDVKKGKVYLAQFKTALDNNTPECHLFRCID